MKSTTACRIGRTSALSVASTNSVVRRPYADDDAAGFGASRADYEKEVIAGNTFDYPALHGCSIVSAGYSFVSCSNESVIDDEVNLGDYRAVDLILGKQRETVLARGACPPEFRAFPPELQLALADYCNGGGNLLVSGAYVGSDLWESDTTGHRRNSPPTR